MKHGFAFCVVRRILLTMTYDPENYSHVNIKSYTINIHITIILKYTNIIKLDIKVKMKAYYQQQQQKNNEISF
jgi:hypothetical protein